jgi:sulfatase maturation enzyme AslB (radical SAM superfamily)
MISYTTNCSSVPAEWISRIKQFKDLHVNISLDAIGKTLEYVRTNANWNLIENNIKKTLELTNSYSFRPVLTAYNFITVEEWVEYFFQYPLHTVDISPVYGEIPLKITAIPDHIRKRKIVYLRSLNHPIANSIIKIANTYTFDKNYLNKFKHKTETDDKNRNTSIFELHNDFKEIWE